MIKLASPADAQEIEALIAKSFAEVKNVYTPDAYNATAVNETEIIHRMSEGPVWIAGIHGKMAGTVAGVIHKDSLYIRGMAVDPEYRGKGIANLLLNETQKFATTQNLNRLYLGTTKFLLGAIRLYERNGFTKYDVTDYYGMELYMFEKFINL